MDIIEIIRLKNFIPLGKFCFNVGLFWLLLGLMVQVGDEERIHVYYAHGQDNPTFVRRCYWLLDKYVVIKLYFSWSHC